ncbi:alpha-ketoacid dehydrogenase subunit beta [Halomarina pelagica]|uniref:alpha-ketoacid dehydrogenase subunit beta n=1 Tax=Halomarina pelagica TaxID=2961599 RepID=UPI0020C3AE75|nr:alpha-ketoacid dehydrogenase subunit beta [Halomarina sp. BND7]
MANNLNVVEAVRQGLDEELARDEGVIVYGEDVGVNGGVFRATQGLLEKYPDQVYDSPLAEAGIIGTGVGLATYGLTPVPEIQFAGFIDQGFHQLKQHVSRLRSRSRGRFNCQMTVRAPYGGGIHALEHHSESFEAGYAHVQGIKVVVPSTPADTKGLLTASIRDPDPVVFLEPMRIYRRFREDVPEGDHTVPLGEATVRREGDDVTVISWGAMMWETLRAVEDAEASVEAIDLRTISPLDTETVVESVRKTGRCVVVHEAPRTAGMAAEVIARLNEEAFLYLEAPVERVTGYDLPFPLFAREERYIPDRERILGGIEMVVDF